MGLEKGVEDNDTNSVYKNDFDFTTRLNVPYRLQDCTSKYGSKRTVEVSTKESTQDGIQNLEVIEVGREEEDIITIDEEDEEKEEAMCLKIKDNSNTQKIIYRRVHASGGTYQDWKSIPDYWIESQLSLSSSQFNAEWFNYHSMDNTDLTRSKSVRVIFMTTQGVKEFTVMQEGKRAWRSEEVVKDVTQGRVSDDMKWVCERLKANKVTYQQKWSNIVYVLVHTIQGCRSVYVGSSDTLSRPCSYYMQRFTTMNMVEKFKQQLTLVNASRANGNQGLATIFVVDICQNRMEREVRERETIILSTLEFARDMCGTQIVNKKPMTVKRVMTITEQECKKLVEMEDVKYGNLKKEEILGPVPVLVDNIVSQ
jgi:hypothetical protein